VRADPAHERQPRVPAYVHVLERHDILIVQTHPSLRNAAWTVRAGDAHGGTVSFFPERGVTPAIARVGPPRFVAKRLRRVAFSRTSRRDVRRRGRVGRRTARPSPRTRPRPARRRS